MLTTIDPFDAVQLAYVIEICINHKNQAAAGRYLYANSRDKLKSPNDSDRLRKYLMKFGLRFDELSWTLKLYLSKLYLSKLYLSKLYWVKSPPICSAKACNFGTIIAV